ncbi:MAG TPA: sigma-70 family RNA polymerase sigma factor [Verrucomicrobiae bacterium]|nr:sigma-70 family RNA polymerase sigma factor [Verrucomicrobiae bacterium]
MSGDLMVLMNAKTDADLIRAYVEQGAESAFAELVHRHLGFVYASALRQVRRPDLAADVAQAVFLLLAHKASGLRREVVLSGWLFRTTRFVAARARRSEQRRQHREQEALVMNFQSQTSPSDDILWHEISPHLDDAVAALPEADRRAVLLRFFESKPLRAVGEQLGLSEEAAKKRVSRALEKMRAFLTHRGITLSSVTLGTLLLQPRAQATPAGLAQTICATVAVGTATTSMTVAGLVAAGMRDLLWLKTRSFLPWVAGVAVLILGTASFLSSREPATDTEVASKETEVENAELAAATSDVASSINPATNSTERFLFLNVMDRENQPIAGARVIADVWGIGKVESSEQITGPEGSLAFRVPDEPFSTFRVWLAAPGYVPIVMDWRRHEFLASDVFHTCRLTRGATFGGEVRDDSGQPVFGAKVNFGGPGIDSTRREQIGFLSRLTEVRTDEAGRFQSDQMPPALESGRNIGVSVSHPDFAMETFWLRDPQAFTTNHVIVMTKGVALRGTIVGLNGEPVAKAGLQEVEEMFGLETRADASGRFEIPHVKPGNYTFRVWAKGYAELRKTLVAAANGPEVTLQLEELPTQPSGEPGRSKPVRLIGTVLDAEGGHGVTRFRVLMNEHRGVSDTLLGEGFQGAFDWPVERGFVSEFSLIVEAEGYEPQESDKRRFQSAEHRFEFRLKRAADFTGVVLQPDGHPATNASVGLAADGKYTLRLADGGKLVNYGHAVNRTTTDEKGRFILRRMVGAEKLLVSHATGSAVVPTASVTNVFIPLRAWGEIEGRVLIGKTPASNQPVILSLGAAQPDPTELIPFDYTTTTDAEGRFHFTHVQPGTHLVHRRIMFFKGQTGLVGSSHGETVTIHPNEITEVVLGGKGIAMTGRLELLPPVENYDWSLDLFALVQQRPDVLDVRREDFGDNHHAYLRAWSARESQIRKYYLAIQPDGSFRTDDVLPGTYLLQLNIKAMPNDPLADDASMQPRRELGKVTVPVTVSADETREVVDLGTITIPLTNSPPPTHSARLAAPAASPAKDQP